MRLRYYSKCATTVVQRVRRLPYNEQYGKNGGAKKRYDFSDTFK